MRSLICRSGKSSLTRRQIRCAVCRCLRVLAGPPVGRFDEGNGRLQLRVQPIGLLAVQVGTALATACRTIPRCTRSLRATPRWFLLQNSYSVESLQIAPPFSSSPIRFLPSGLEPRNRDIRDRQFSWANLKFRSGSKSEYRNHWVQNLPDASA
jgi:hypothetical protein